MDHANDGIVISTQAVVLVSVGLTVISMLWTAFNSNGKKSERLDSVQSDVKEIKVAIQRLEDKMEYA